MPELPEVESVRRSLEPRLVGARIESVVVVRADVVTGPSPGGLCAAVDLLEKDVVARLERRGKQLALIGRSGRVVVVQLGMSGQLVFGDRVFGGGGGALAKEARHVHAVWRTRAGELWFRDPRRFGGITALADERSLRTRWQALGPDGLSVSGDDLCRALGASRRAVKAGLLDQSAVAGIGNIYADEALFMAGIAPRRLCTRVRESEWDRLAEALRETLRNAIAHGGSTLRDYVDGNGQPGAYRSLHVVYGRGGEPCVRCGRVLSAAVIAQRTTVWCKSCQRMKVLPLSPH